MPPTEQPAVIDHRTVAIVVAPRPGELGVPLAVFPDPRAAPDPGSALTSMLALALVNLQADYAALVQRVAVLEILATEQARRGPLAQAPDLVASDDARYTIAFSDRGRASGFNRRSGAMRLNREQTRRAVLDNRVQGPPCALFSHE